MIIAAQHSPASRDLRRASDPSAGSGSAGGTRGVFRQFSGLKAGSGKVAFSRPAHQRVTHTVGRLFVLKENL